MQLVFPREGAVKEHALGEVQLLSVEDVARLLGVHVRTVRRLVKKGSLVAYRITSRVVRVDRTSVMRLLETTRIAGSPGAYACPSENEGTSMAFRTFSASVAAGRSGRATSPTEARSRSGPQTPPKPSVGSLPLPQTAAELKESLRRLRRPS